VPEALRSLTTEVMDLAAEATDGLIVLTMEGESGTVSASIDPKSIREGVRGERASGVPARVPARISGLRFGVIASSSRFRGVDCRVVVSGDQPEGKPAEQRQGMSTQKDVTESCRLEVGG
jgi:hypothetical protein